MGKKNSRDDILSRIRKLLAMAEDKSSPMEAELAAVRARELLDKHNLTLEDVDLQDSDIVFGETPTGFKRLPRWMRKLAAVVGAHFECRVYLCTDKIGRETLSKNYYFVGYESDVQVASFVFEYLKKSILNRLYGFKGKGRVKVAFGLGMIEGIDFRLEDYRKNRHRSPREEALVVTKSANINRFVQNNNLYNEARKAAPRSPVRVDQEGMKAYHLGMDVGQDIPINPGVCDEKDFIPKAIAEGRNKMDMESA